MRIQVALVLLATGCGVPVDIGMLEDSTGTGSGGPVTDDATLTQGMTGPLPMTSTPDDSSSSEIPDDPPPAPQHDFAIIEGPAVDTGGSDETDTGGGSGQSTSASSTSNGTDTSGVEVGTLTITATTGTASCEDPFGIEPCPATWTYRFKLPPDMQFVGASGQLDQFDGFMSEVGDEPSGCSFGAGSLFGSFEITDIDDTHVAGRMFDLELTMWETDVVFDAPICAAPE